MEGENIITEGYLLKPGDLVVFSYRYDEFSYDPRLREGHVYKVSRIISFEKTSNRNQKKYTEIILDKIDYKSNLTSCWIQITDLEDGSLLGYSYISNQFQLLSDTVDISGMEKAMHKLFKNF